MCKGFLNSNFAQFSSSNIQRYTKLDFETQSVKQIQKKIIKNLVFHLFTHIFLNKSSVHLVKQTGCDNVIIKSNCTTFFK